jgi:hypothetical protein
MLLGDLRKQEGPILPEDPAPGQMSRVNLSKIKPFESLSD